MLGKSDTIVTDYTLWLEKYEIACGLKKVDDEKT